MRECMTIYFQLLTANRSSSFEEPTGRGAAIAVRSGTHFNPATGDGAQTCEGHQGPNVRVHHGHTAAGKCRGNGLDGRCDFL
jgi:hypothetical protein